MSWRPSSSYTWRRRPPSIATRRASSSCVIVVLLGDECGGGGSREPSPLRDRVVLRAAARRQGEGLLRRLGRLVHRGFQVLGQTFCQRGVAARHQREVVGQLLGLLLD